MAEQTRLHPDVCRAHFSEVRIVIVNIVFVTSELHGDGGAACRPATELEGVEDRYRAPR